MPARGEGGHRSHTNRVGGDPVALVGSVAVVGADPGGS